MKPRIWIVASLWMTGCALGDSPSSSTGTDDRLGRIASAEQFGLFPVGNLGRDGKGVMLMLDVGSDHVGISQLYAGGRPWFATGREVTSPLFEVADGPCVWTSNGVVPPYQIAIAAPVVDGNTTRINARLTGCAGVPPRDVSLSLRGSGGEIRMDGTIASGVLRSTSEWGWSAPFVLGDTAQGSPPVFGADANVAAVRSRAVYPISYCPASFAAGSPPTCDERQPTSVRTEAFVVGFDGLIYGSQEVNDSAWSVPTPLYDSESSRNRNVFPGGGPIAALRRNDEQTDLFAVSLGGGELANAEGHGVGPQLMTVYRVGANAPWSPPTFVGRADGPPLRPGSPLAALSLHEEFDTRVNELEVYVPSVDGQIYAYREYNNGAWGPPSVAISLTRDEATPPDLFCRVPTDRPVHIAAVSRNHRQRDLFFIDTLGRLCESFKLRTTEQPPDDRATWASPRAISGRLFVPGAEVAVAHGAGNSEHAFAIGTDLSIYELEELDDSGWSASKNIKFGVAASSSASIAAARRSARDVVVSFVGAGGEVFEMRSVGRDWSAPTAIPGLAGSPTRKLALSLRKPEQLDIFSTAGNGDGRLWSNGDGVGRSDVRLVLPKLLFPAGELAGARGMIPAEMGGDSSLKTSLCNTAINNRLVAGNGCTLGMPYDNDPRAQDTGVPQSMNLMEVAHVTKEGASFFVADVSPPIESGRSPAQLIASEAEVSGLWTHELYPGRSLPLPSIEIGGYASSDWHPAVDAYRAAHVDDPAPVDTPSWLRNAGALFTYSAGGAGGIYLRLPGAGYQLHDYANGQGFAAALSKMLREAQAMGTNVVYLYDYWSNEGTRDDGTCARPSAPYPAEPAYFCKGDYRIRCDLGDCIPNDVQAAMTALRTGVAAVQRAGGHVILYVEPFVWGVGPDVMNQFHDLFWARNPEGVRNPDGSRRPDGAPWLPFLPPPTNAPPVALSYAHSGWQDRFVELTRRLVADTGADGVFLDSGAWRLNERVQTKDEVVRASPLEHARAFLDLTDRVRRAVRDARPRSMGPAVVLSETIGGPAARHLDGAVSADFSPDFSSGAALAESFDQDGNLVGPVLRATPTRYAMRSANIFGNGLNLNQLQQVYAAGHNLALATDAQSAAGFMTRNRDYIQRLVSRRIAHANALVDGAQSPLQVVGEPANVIARLYSARRSRTSFASSRRDVVTVVNVGGATNVALDIADVAGSGRRFCDIIARKEYLAVGNALNTGMMPATDDSCPGGTTCEGLRVFVREPCAAEP